MGLIEDIKNDKSLSDFHRSEYLELAYFAEDFDRKYDFGEYSFTDLISSIFYKKYISEKEKDIFDEIYYIKDMLTNIHYNIMEAELEKEEAEQINKCWEQYTNNEFTSDILTFIPEEVETGSYEETEEIEEKHHGIKIVELKTKTIGRHYRLPVVKTVPSYKTVPLEQDIKRSCEQRSREESIQRERYRN